MKPPAASHTTLAQHRPIPPAAVEQATLPKKRKHNVGDGEEKPVATRKRAAIVRRDDALWLRETISLSVAIGILISIVAIFYHYRWQPYATSPRYISINSLVAVLLAVFKPALTFPIVRCLEELKWIFTGGPRSPSELRSFDSASRGPWGAFLLLHHKFGKLASLGAVLCILNLAVDPFVQQMVSNQIYMVPAQDGGNGTSYISRSNWFYGMTADNVLDPELGLDIYQGILSPPPNSTAFVNNYCPVDRCEIGTYSSLAMCYGVDDLSQQVIGTASSAASSPGAGAMTLNYTLPGTELWVASGSQLLASAATYPGANATAGGNVSVFSFQMLLLSQSQSQSQPQPLAAGVYLYPCVYTFSNSSILYGRVLAESPSPSTPLQPFAQLRTAKSFSLAGNFPMVGGFPESDGPDCTPAATPGGNKTALAVPASNGLWAYVDQPSNDLSDYPEKAYYDPGCTYLFPGSVASQLQKLSGQFFGANQTLTGEAGQAASIDGPIMLKQLYGEGQVNIQGVQALARGLADSLTTSIRNNTYAPDTSINDFVTGQEYEDVVVIVIEWPWIGLPAGVLILTTLFFFAVMLFSRRKGRGRAPRSRASDQLWNRLQTSEEAAFNELDPEDAVPKKGRRSKWSFWKQMNSVVEQVDD